MPKTDVKKIESEDVAELTDEALDRATSGNAKACGCGISCSAQAD
jgi:hypothetical protein|tara:strand:+ start:243 stop:377 length:135 start_codon:yes stop_codon:yes gene_type:complete